MSPQDLKNLSMHLSSVDLITVMVLSQVSLKRLSDSCSWSRTLLLDSLLKPKSWIILLQFSDLYTGFQSVKELSLKYWLLVYKTWNGLRPKYILICCYLVNLLDLLYFLGQVCFLSLEYKPNIQKTCSVFMLHISGTICQKTAGLLQHSALFKTQLKTFLLSTAYN